jgi:glucosamine kinase
VHQATHLKNSAAFVDKPLVLAFDGGGTKLSCCAFDEHGKAAAVKKITGNFNVLAGDRTEILNHIVRLTLPHRAKRLTLVLGFAGLGRAADRKRFRADLVRELGKRRVTAAEIFVFSDLDFTLAAGLQSADGIAAIIGTGSAFVLQTAGKQTVIGGWGRTLGDAGSGMSIGREAARGVMEIHDGLRTDKQFINAFRKVFPNRESVIHNVYSKALPLQTLAPLVINLAAKGNPTAKQILEREANEIISYLEALVRKTNNRKLKLALSGGLVETPNAYRKLLEQKIKQQLPALIFNPTPLSLLQGAYLLTKHRN